MSKPTYAILTSVKNEEKYIDRCITSVERQTVRPVTWVIVNDGSSDGTAGIIVEHVKTSGFILCLDNGPSKVRSFGAQYRAIQRAYETVKHLQFDFVAVLDGDIELEQADYYERLFAEFEKDKTLGIAGGYVCEQAGGTFESRPTNRPWSVAGGIQTFRREVFDNIKGYTPLEYGGSDWLAQVAAERMNWKARAIPALRVRHHRPTSTADGALKGMFRQGLMDGSFKCHPLFEMVKCSRRVFSRPILIGSACKLAGYLWYRVWYRQCLIPDETASYLRRKQLSRVTDLLRLQARNQ